MTTAPPPPSRSTKPRRLLPPLAAALALVSFGALSADPTLAKTPSSAPDDKVTLCHLTGNGGYVEITVAASAVENGHGGHAGDIIPAPATGCPTTAPTSGPGAGSDGGDDKVTLCHLTGNGGYVEITVAASAAENGHGKHAGDIIPAPAGGCPATAAGSPDGDPEKVAVCHLTGNGSYVKILIALAGWENGHSKHEGDILLASPQDACPATTAVLSGADDVTLCHLDETGTYVKMTVSQSDWENIHVPEGTDFLFTAEASIPCSEGAAAFAAAVTAASSGQVASSSPQAGSPAASGQVGSSPTPAGTPATPGQVGSSPTAAGTPATPGQVGSSPTPAGAPAGGVDGALPETGNETLALAGLAAALCAAGLLTLRSAKRRPSQTTS